MSGSRNTVLMPGGTDGINRWWDSGGELFGIVCRTRGEVSVTRCPTLLPPTRHGCKSLPDTPYKEPNEMREKIIRYEPAGRGILSIKDAFYLAGSSSCLFALPRSLRHPPLPLSSPPPWSSAFFALLSSGPFLRHPLRCADTSQQPTTSYYSKVISLSAPLGTLPSFIRERRDKPGGYFYGYGFYTRMRVCLF